MYCSCPIYGAKVLSPQSSSRAAIRGGNWNNASNAGVFSLNLNNAPSNTNTNIGFRAASNLYPDIASGLPERGIYGYHARKQRLQTQLLAKAL